MATVRVEPKVWFSEERTFLHWAKLSVVIATVASLFAGKANADTLGLAACAAAVGLLSVTVLGYAYRRHLLRVRALSSGGQATRVEDFSDSKGGFFLAGALSVAILGIVGLRATSA
eukprot:TRINITY_DN76601_c0_g1_i1.p1 TRINITY_DN76601_c0_g1~~TRINITY_DN76601_c0_g1_i1.p1  ORF type:complete len:116 (-),score=19.42 TRINITY_DN76601_c0_g1_i1:149-496(-)